VRKKELCDI